MQDNELFNIDSTEYHIELPTTSIDDLFDMSDYELEYEKEY